MRLLARLQDREVRRWLARVSAILLFVAVAGLVVRTIGESERTSTSVTQAKADITALLERQEVEIRADCDFKRKAALLPQFSRYPTKALVELSTAARRAYIEKGCAAAGFGPPPPTFTPRPSPSPARPDG